MIGIGFIIFIIIINTLLILILTITTTFIDDLILTNASITTGIRQTLSIVLTWAGQTIVDHLFAHGASISGLASARESRSRLRVFYALATILAREREANAGL